MKKDKLILIVLLVIALMMTACRGSEPASAASEPAATTAPAAAATEAATQALPAETETPVEGDAATHYIDQVYSAQIRRYFDALTQQWDEGKYYENEMSPLASYYYEGNALENVGFALEDLDHDGNLELIIGGILNAQQDPAIFEIWTLRDGSPEMLVQSGYRNRYFLEYSQEDGNWLIANDGSNGAANFASHYYYLENGQMKVMQAVVFDAMANEENPWFMAYDNDWDTANDTPIDEQTANAVMDAHRQTYVVPEYIPYSLYQ